MDNLTYNQNELTELLDTLKLSAFANNWLNLVEEFEKQKKSSHELLLELARRELAVRQQKRIERLLKQA